MLQFLIPIAFASTIATTTINTNIITTNEEAMAFASSTFVGTPLMAVTRCESHFHQWDDTGAVLRGKENRLDIGFGQINAFYHEKDAAKMGFDIYSAEGNILFTKWLYDHQGLKPWVWSRGCWSKLI